MEFRATLNFQKFKVPKHEWYTIENLINIFFHQAKSILPFEWMIWVKYNRRYHFFDKDRMLNSDKHFENDLP